MLIGYAHGTCTVFQFDAFPIYAHGSSTMFQCPVFAISIMSKAVLILF